MRTLGKCLFFSLALVFATSFKAYSTKEKDFYKLLIKPYFVIAEMTGDAKVHREMSEVSDFETFERGELVEIIQDRSAKWYNVRNVKTMHEGWTLRENLSIPEDEGANKLKLAVDEIEGYVNSGGYESESNFFVLTDVDRQITYVLTGKAGEWKFIREIVCSTGKNESPTTRGSFVIDARGKWFFSKRLGSGAKFWVRFNGAYLFHSIPMDEKKQVIDDILGERRSSGCVRMSLDDAEWFFDTIPDKTSVLIL